MISAGQLLNFLDKAISLGYAVEEIITLAEKEIPELSDANKEGIPDVAQEVLNEREKALKR